MSHPIWIVDGKLDFRDIVDNESSYIAAWATIVEHWLFEPARHLASGNKVSDRGIALLTLELAFFEPFGSVLTGKASNDASHSTFSVGLKRFADWLSEKNFIGTIEKTILSVEGTKITPNLVYSFARCGLMHNMTMKGGRIFIDARKSGRYSITDYKYSIPSQARDGLIENAETILLIDPWRLLPQLVDFLGDFVKELDGSDTNSEFYQNFKKIFERMFVAPGKIYLGL